MQQKGLTFVAEGRADLNVRYTLGTPRKVDAEAYPTTKSLVWRAIARDEQSDASKIQPKLDKMVEKAFEKYPPKEKG